MHGEFLRLLFLQAHRETTAPFTAIGMPAQQHCNSFRYRRAAFYNGLKSKVGLAAAKAAALRVNLNITGCSIVAPPARPSRSSHASLLDTLLSHNLPMPHVHGAGGAPRQAQVQRERPRAAASDLTRTRVSSDASILTRQI